MLLLFLFILVLSYFFIEYEEDAQQCNRTLEHDGYCVVKPGEAMEQLPDYVFLDYEYNIKGTALSTFHRDVTSSQRIYHTVHPVYTLIVYDYEGELLSLCPRSHRDYPFVWSPIINYHGKRGTAFLFDCDVLHAGRENQCKYRNVTQYKLCHREDVPILSHLQEIRVTKDEKCVDSLYTRSLRKLSYYGQLPINCWLYPLMIKKQDNWIGKIQNYIPLSFYNN